MKNVKYIILLFIILFLGAIKINAIDSLDGLICEDSKCYLYINGEKQTGFQEVDGKTYFFSRINDNAMRTGMFWIDGDYYYFDEENGIQTGLQQIGDKYYYFGTDGKRKKGFQEIDGKTYFFSRINDNAMRTGMFWIDGNYYYFDEENGMATGLQQIGDKYYYFGTDGKRKQGFQEIDGKTFFFDVENDNAMVIGWKNVDGYVYYFNEDGSILIGDNVIDSNNVIIDEYGRLKNGIVTYDGKKYYYNNYQKQLGFQEVEGKSYFFSRINDNAMRTGMFWIDGDYYYFDLEKGMQTGIQQIDGSYYYFGTDGKRKHGFQEVEGKTYFFSRIGDNAMRTGMFWIDGDYYYFDLEKGMQTGLQQIGDNYYYFGTDGKRKKGFQEAGGKTYFFSRINDNAMKYGWQLIDGYFYYFKSDGSMATDQIELDGIQYNFTSDGKVKLSGWNSINGTKYYFNASCMVISNSVKLVIDISHHQGNINWEELHNSGQVYGVIIRLGYLDYGCRKYVDTKLKEYTDAVKKYNIPYGLYWFSYADNANEAAIEAQYTKELIRDYNLNPTLGIYYDLEYVIPNPSPIMYQNITRTYIDSMRRTYGQYNVKVYASTYFALDTIGFRGEEANNYIGWIAHWNDVNAYPYNYDMWQYSDAGSIPGISTNVDLNYYFR